MRLLPFLILLAQSGPTPSPMPDASPTVRGAMNLTIQQLKGPKIFSDRVTIAADAGPAISSTGVPTVVSLGACPTDGSGVMQFVRGLGWYACQTDGGGWSPLGTGGSTPTPPPPPPPFPTPPTSLFYMAPNGGFGMGSGPCRGQLMVDVNQNVIVYGRSAGVAGDGGVQVATCIRETDGLGIELADSEPNIWESPDRPGTRGPLNEGPGTNFLTSTWDLGSTQWSATATVTRDVWPGPFSHYRTASGFEQINDTSGSSSQSVCQTFTTSTATTYAFSCTLRAGTLSTARLSIAGTGNSAGDRTCSFSGLDATLSRDDRKGCVTTSAYAGGLSAVTVCVLPGSSSAATGTIGAVDCQLEKNDHITSYIPNGWSSGSATRLISSATFPTAPTTLTLSDTAGCAATDLYTFKYDSETFWSILTLVGSGNQRGPYYFPDTSAKASDETNFPAVSRASLFNATASAKSMWAADGGFSIEVYDAGITTGPYDGTMFGTTISAGGMFVESSTGSQDGIVTNVILDNADSKCAQASMANIDRIGWIGDSLSARISPDAINPPAGFFAAKSLNGSNLAVIGAKFDTSSSNCVSQWVQGGNGTYNEMFVWCGVNDIQADVGGVALEATEQAWIEEWAYRGIVVYWLDIAPFDTYVGSNGSRVTERNNFNTAQATYCVSPAAGVHCIAVSSQIWDPSDHNALLPLYTIDGLHLTQSGATAVSAFIASVYP